MKNIIGRKAELEKFKRFTTSEKSEFVALFGRRRVGKTFLIREYFSNNFTFQLTGIANATTEEQLLNFDLQLQQFQKGELVKTKNLNAGNIVR
jgi:AAA+ ATPase superfamily predicted ATPase